MVDINGRTIEVGQRVAFSVMFGRSGTSHWISIGEVIDIKKTPKRETCTVKTLVHGTNSCYGDSQYVFKQDDTTFNNKLLIL